MLTVDERLANYLRSNSMIESAPLARGVRISKTQRTSLDQTLLSLGLIEEEKLLRALASILSIPFEQNVLREEISNTLIESIGYEHLRQSQIVPRYGKNGRIEILTANPNDVVQIEGIEFLLEQKVVLVATLSKVIRYLLSENIDISSEYSEEILDRETGRLQDDSVEGPVVQFVNNVLAETVESGGSDVHFESTKDGLRIRIRLHGILHTHPVDQSLNPSSVFARLKILAEMNVTERRRPQDGRIAQTFSGRPVDFRVSTIPTQFGESIVCRVLDPYSLKLGWNALGFDETTTSWIKSIIEQPSGMFLVTGPTGSGKTTTLYTALAHLNSVKRKIISIEDPIEYNLDGIEQLQIHEGIDLTFANALRAILRQDPNVIMVGEIRDEETASMACRAALVGRMVLSTLHTNSPQGAVLRLMDLGVPEYLIRDVLRGVLGQTLVVEKYGRKLVVDRHVV